jgi:hypothetical protein
MMIGVVDPVVLGAVEVVVFGIRTLFGDTVSPGVTVFGKTVPFGVVVPGSTVWPELTVVPVPEFEFRPPLGTTVELGPITFGATVLLGPAVFGATVLLGPVSALVGFCALAAPFGTRGVPFGASVAPGATMSGVAARCPCCWAKQAGRWVAVNVMQLVPGGKVLLCARVVVAKLVPSRSPAANTAGVLRLHMISSPMLLPVLARGADTGIRTFGAGAAARSAGCRSARSRHARRGVGARSLNIGHCLVAGEMVGAFQHSAI